jgi:hypothetical protein
MAKKNENRACLGFFLLFYARTSLVSSKFLHEKKYEISYKALSKSGGNITGSSRDSSFLVI